MSEQYVVTTYFLKPGSKHPITHAYGATSRAEAEKMRLEMLNDASDDQRLAEEGAMINISVNKVLWFPTSVAYV